MTEHETHQLLRELLGSFVLGHLAEHEAAPIRAHLDGCAACRAELDDLRSVAAALETIDPAAFAPPAAPPADLGERIRSAVRHAPREEPSPLKRPSKRPGAPVLLAAAAVLATALGGGVVIGRTTSTSGPGTGPSSGPSATVTVTATPAPVPTEPIALRPSTGTRITFDSAVLVNHTWGTELRIAARGFAAGTTYRASFRERDGGWVPAGEFLGVGTSEMTCNLQSAALRADVTEVVLRDPAGALVASAAL